MKNWVKRAEMESRLLGNNFVAVSTELAAVLIVAFGPGPTSCRAADAVEGHWESWCARALARPPRSAAVVLFA